VKLIRWLAALAMFGTAAPGWAGPPYLTDDPVTTDFRHWEIYNFASFDGRGSDFDGEGGFDLNYGAGKNLQLTATVPLAFSHSVESGWRAGTGDLELAAKYRFINDDKSGWQASIFPRVILPTSTNGLGGRRVRLLLPLWVQKDIGKTSVFGGAEYEINPGSGNRNFVHAGIAVAHDVSEKLQLGAELSTQSAEVRGGKASTNLDLGMIDKLGGPFSLLTAAGPGFSAGQTGYHGYVALGLNF
jgi:hypothetical protein